MMFEYGIYQSRGETGRKAADHINALLRRLFNRSALQYLYSTKPCTVSEQVPSSNSWLIAQSSLASFLDSCGETRR
jgi:hypothetical protein